LVVVQYVVQIDDLDIVIDEIICCNYGNEVVQIKRIARHKHYYPV
jgi:hypothetical protein